jgi:predicted lipid-binding transport protein (Tim44 family)
MRALHGFALDGLAENNFGDTRGGGLAGPMGLFIILLLGIATVLLIRNMSSRIRRLPAEFPEPGGTQPGGAQPGDREEARRVNGTDRPAGSDSAGSQTAESNQADRVPDRRQKPYGA